MLIENATLDDALAVAQVHVLSWQVAYHEILPPEYLRQLSVLKNEAMWRESIVTGVPELLVARADGSIVGFIAFGPTRDTDRYCSDAEIWAFYLEPDSWSTGIGRALWLAVRQRLVDQGSRSISLWAIANNERAINFYRSAGFEPEPSSLKTFELGGRHLQEIRYVQRFAT
jgi:ribosomal protein S18 acetylase RimI-like enzyme